MVICTDDVDFTLSGVEITSVLSPSSPMLFVVVLLFVVAARTQRHCCCCCLLLAPRLRLTYFIKLSWISSHSTIDTKEVVVDECHYVIPSIRIDRIVNKINRMVPKLTVSTSFHTVNFGQIDTCGTIRKAVYGWFWNWPYRFLNWPYELKPWIDRINLSKSTVWSQKIGDTVDYNWPYKNKINRIEIIIDRIEVIIDRINLIINRIEITIDRID